ncbi:Small ribosomal subunit biogenesis GTPase RsgA [bioreactor metagenome]|uniref:Small ribosomal subunit biogenesis GTPase RsgA n=1 Tax=bioreactor metagenome TaxID=1076179 RepID=A0A644WPF3_9ZZZZ
MEGIVVCSTGRWCDVHAGDNIYKCSLKGNLRLKGMKTTNPVAVGDRVLFDMDEKNHTGRVYEILDRKNVIIRRATNLSRQTHILAANVDLAVLIATPILPRTSTGFIDRFLITAEAYHIPSLIVFNKLDLFKQEMSIVEYYQEIYQSAGYPVLMISSTEGTNVDEFREQITGKTILLAGHSGVGKSTLIKALVPEIKIKIGNISEAHLKGMHTTTFARMYMLTGNTLVIDTPGIKEFGVVDFEPWELGHWFREFKEFIPGCKYANCTHQHEPGCAVRQAAEAGKIHEERYSNYLGILNNISE